MSVKFRLGFTVEAQTLFALMSKLLPIENLHVEELIEREPKLAIAAHRTALPKRRGGTRGFGSRGGVKIDAGANLIVIEALSNGPRRAAELKPLLKARGFSPSGVGSCLSKLRKAGVVEQPELGVWQLARKNESAA